MKKIIFIAACCICCASTVQAATVCRVLSCNSGYYTTSEMRTCTRCPYVTTSTGAKYYGLTASGAGLRLIKDCYIPSTVVMSFSDSTGSGTRQFKSNCYYK